MRVAVLAVVAMSCGPPGTWGTADLTLDGAPYRGAAGFYAEEPVLGDTWQFTGWMLMFSKSAPGTSCHDGTIGGDPEIDILMPPVQAREVPLGQGTVPLQLEMSSCVYPNCASLLLSPTFTTSATGTLTIDSFSMDYNHFAGSISVTVATAQNPTAMLVGTFDAQRCK